MTTPVNKIMFTCIYGFRIKRLTPHSTLSLFLTNLLVMAQCWSCFEKQKTQRCNEAAANVH